MKTRQATLMMAALLFVAVYAAGWVVADPAAPVTALTPIASSARDTSTLGAQSIDARGGNVTEVNIEALTITKSWQGYYGQISGEITLDDGNNNTFYNWSVTNVAGQVYATRASSITWDNVNCSTALNITSEETYLGQSATDGDSVTNTFTTTTHMSFDVTPTATIFANTCNSTRLFVNNATQASNWTEVLLHDQVNNIVYASIINESTPGFNGNTYDFQILVGENEHTGSEGITSYYFWVQLV